MNVQLNSLASTLIMLIWIAGVVLAKGFWSTLIALVFPPWALYLTVEASLLNYTSLLG
jgi:hypothetical protein